MNSARFASPLRRPEHSTPRPFPQVSFGLHSRGGSFFLRGISWRRTTRAGSSVCGPLVRKVVPRRREGIRIGIKSRPAPITVSDFGARSCAWGHVQSFPHTSSPGHWTNSLIRPTKRLRQWSHSRTRQLQQRVHVRCECEELVVRSVGGGIARHRS